jgi:AcrR family transcriptional regulator
MPSDRLPDRRVQRTHDALRDALLVLMVERGWDAIDVQALCDRANIGRSTFYLHFANKEDLLKASFATLREALQQPGDCSAGPFDFLDGLLAHVHEERQVFRALLGRRSGQVVQERFRVLLVEMMQTTLARLDPAATPAWQHDAKAHYLGGALFELLVWWLGTAREQTADEVKTLFCALSHEVMRSGN